MRTLLLRGGMVLIMPLLFGLDGIWAAVVVAEGLGVLISGTLMALKGRQPIS